MFAKIKRIPNFVNDKIARGEPVFSMTVRLVRGAEIGAIAAAAGFDALYIDLQHSGISIETAGQISIAALAMGVAPFVRVPGVDPHIITSALDAGAIGVIVPDMHSAEDARAVVRCAKYRPEGERSLPGIMSQLGYRSLPASEATAELNAAITIVAMIESAAGLAAADEIAAVPGVDILLVGANDLCTEVGVPGQFDHPIVEEAYSKVLAACRKHGKALGVGGLASRPDLIKKYVAMGGLYVSLGADLSMLVNAATQKRKEIG
ncbi:HpcH/HpaI aldolase family protein [Variovorax sp. HJSM1_2]|uniref:HpcH/HpaI aldolase family protein n=1 Tax=Variovorax sp. HJSM1_2 TaxID=3366263 RepID=UPI003BD0466F